MQKVTKMPIGLGMNRLEQEVAAAAKRVKTIGQVVVFVLENTKEK